MRLSLAGMLAESVSIALRSCLTFIFVGVAVVRMLDARQGVALDKSEPVSSRRGVVVKTPRKIDRVRVF